MRACQNNALCRPSTLLFNGFPLVYVEFRLMETVVAEAASKHPILMLDMFCVFHKKFDNASYNQNQQIPGPQ